MKNNKGFTLIELLAVIVVLSVVITIATTNVLPTMNIAREEAFRTEATLFAKNAKEAYEKYILKEINIDNDSKGCVSSSKACFTVDKLVDLGESSLKKETYKGKVILNLSNQTIANYNVYLKKADEYWFINEEHSDFSSSGELNTGTWNDEYEICSCD